jgi:hypothetical protein
MGSQKRVGPQKGGIIGWIEGRWKKGARTIVKADQDVKMEKMRGMGKVEIGGV